MIRGIEHERCVGADLTGKFRMEDVPLNPEKAGGPDESRAHCHDDGWQSWVECAADEVVTAVTAHFEAGEPPRAVTGPALECTQVKPVL